MDLESLGLRIRRLRTSKKISQEELALTVGIERSFLSYMENGSKAPSLETIVAIANALGVSADQLLVDSLSNSGSVKDTEIEYLLLDCTEQEKALITKNAVALREILRGYNLK